MKTLGALLIGLAVLAASHPSGATPQTFFGEDLNLAGPTQDPTQLSSHPNSDAAHAAFLSNLIGVQTETFESIANNRKDPVLNFGVAGIATVSGAGRVRSGISPTSLYPISGQKYYNAQNGNFSIDFSQPIAALGFYATDVSDYGASLSLDLTDTLGNVTHLTVPNTIGRNGSTTGSVLYFGFFDLTTQYLSVDFLNGLTNVVDRFGFDDFTIESRSQIQVVGLAADSAPMPFFIAGLLGLFAVKANGRRPVRPAALFGRSDRI